MAEIIFSKIQATGNDFIVVDFQSVQDDFFTPERIRLLCHRNFGIGADGLIALEKTEDYTFRFHYYNSDGSRGEMCGNGCRAAICFARENKWVEENTTFEFLADDGVHQAWMSDKDYAASIIVNGLPSKINTKDYDLPAWIESGYQINTGVPHIVLLVTSDLKTKDIREIARFIRYHKDFKPNGTNVNFTEIIDEDKIYVRTYERGVEDETLSCGTGNTAAAVVLKSLKNIQNSDVKIVTNGGNLIISFENENVFIKGPSKISFKGFFML